MFDHLCKQFEGRTLILVFCSWRQLKGACSGVHVLSVRYQQDPRLNASAESQYDSFSSCRRAPFITDSDFWTIACAALYFPLEIRYTRLLKYLPGHSFSCICKYHASGPMLQEINENNGPCPIIALVNQRIISVTPIIVREHSVLIMGTFWRRRRLARCGRSYSLVHRL